MVFGLFFAPLRLGIHNGDFGCSPRFSFSISSAYCISGDLIKHIYLGGGGVSSMYHLSSFFGWMNEWMDLYYV